MPEKEGLPDRAKEGGATVVSRAKGGGATAGGGGATAVSSAKGGGASATPAVEGSMADASRQSNAAASTAPTSVPRILASAALAGVPRIVASTAPAGMPHVIPSAATAGGPSAAQPNPSHRKDDEPVDRIFVTKIATLLVGGILKERILDRNEEGNYVYDNDGMLKQSERSLIDRSSGDPVKDEWAQLE
ncbi:UNVERIFIED_CONTAM: hypothetical protein FKN15_012902 [Acipenser sinensis]